MAVGRAESNVPATPTQKPNTPTKYPANDTTPRAPSRSTIAARGGNFSTCRPQRGPAPSCAPSKAPIPSGVFLSPHFRNGAHSRAYQSKAKTQTRVGDPSAVQQATHAMQRLTVGPKHVDDPSMAPAPTVTLSNMTTGLRYVQSRFSTMRPDDGKRSRKWIKNKVCTKSPWTRLTFQKGHVISLPYHVPNMDQSCAPNAKGLTFTEQGAVFSKRRMAIVLFKYGELMYCLPLYSFNGRGITSRHRTVLHEYIQVQDMKHEGVFPQAGKYEALEFRHAHPDGLLDMATTVHITGGFSANWEEDIKKVGRIPRESYKKLVKIWRALNEKAENEECDWTKDL